LKISVASPLKYRVSIYNISDFSCYQPTYQYTTSHAIYNTIQLGLTYLLFSINLLYGKTYKKIEEVYK